MTKSRRKLLLRKPIYEFLKSKQKLPELNTPELKKIGAIVNKISKLRPKSNELIDQCPISNKDLTQRVKLILNNVSPINKKRILFIGDDDLASAVLANLSKPQLTVIDIDEEVLSTIKNAVFDHLNIKRINANILDIIDGKTKDPIQSNFDVFVTDPPYTETGYKYFLSYGIKHLTMNGLAFLAVPYMNYEEWSSELLFKVEKILLQNGLVIIEIIPGFAEYMHTDKIISSIIIAKKVSVPIQKEKERFKRSRAYTTGFEL